MEKQIVTVGIVKEYTEFDMPIFGTPTQAYLYTQEEHAAVQGYREALDKINEIVDKPEYSIRTNEYGIWCIINEALSKAEDKGEVNNCDGCMAAMPLVGIYHKNEQGQTHMICSKARYATQPNNGWDELEEWANEDGSDFITIDDIRRKIKSLKIINY